MKYRTLLHVTDVVYPFLGGPHLTVVISSWKPHATVWLQVPDAVLQEVERSPGIADGATIYILCRANLEAERPVDLDCTGPWEIDRVEFEEPGFVNILEHVEVLDAR